MTDVVSLFRLDSGQVMHKQLKLDLDGLACERMVAVHDDGRRREFDDSDLARWPDFWPTVVSRFPIFRTTSEGSRCREIS